MSRLRAYGCGTFKIDLELLEDHPNFVQKVFADMIVVKCEFDVCSQALNYQAYSDRFEVPNEGEAAFRYQLQIGCKTWTNPQNGAKERIPIDFDFIKI